MSSSGTPFELSRNASVCSLDDSIDSKSYTRKHEYFDFKDGNVTFLVENTLFTIHQYFLERDSPTMRSMFARAHLPGIVKGTKENPIELSGTDSLDFERFLKLLYPPKFGEDSLTSSYEWESALRIADMYKFANIRKLAILKLLSDASCSQRLLLGQRYNARLLALTGFRDICNRDVSLSLEEVRSFNAEDITLIMRCREDLLTSTSTHRSSIDDNEVELFFASRLPPSEPELDIVENPPSRSSHTLVSGLRVPRARSTTSHVISPPPSHIFSSSPARTPSPPLLRSPSPPLARAPSPPLSCKPSPPLSYRLPPPRISSSPPPCILGPPPPRAKKGRKSARSGLL